MLGHCCLVKHYFLLLFLKLCWIFSHRLSSRYNLHGRLPVKHLVTVRQEKGERCFCCLHASRGVFRFVSLLSSLLPVVPVFAYSSQSKISSIWANSAPFESPAFSACMGGKTAQIAAQISSMGLIPSPLLHPRNSETTSTVFFWLKSLEGTGCSRVVSRVLHSFLWLLEQLIARKKTTVRNT